MASQAVENPLPTFTGLDGQPLSDGYVYFGEPDMNSIEYPVLVYWDEALTIPATQPIRTNAGYLWRNGTPTRVWVNGNYSTLVQDSRRRQVYYAPDWSAASSANITFLQAGIGAVLLDAQSKMRQYVSVKDFGAVGDGSTDDTLAIQRAVTYAASQLKGVWLNAGEYQITSSINITAALSVMGEGVGASRILCSACSGFNISAGVTRLMFSDFAIAQATRYSTGTPNSYVAFTAQGTTASQCYWHTYRNLFVDGFGQGWYSGGVCSSSWMGCVSVYTYQSITFAEQCLNNSINQCFLGQDSVSTTGSYGVKVGDGTVNCEGLQITDTLVFGVSRGIWNRASINVTAANNILDSIKEFGIIAESTASAGCINNNYTNNYIGCAGTPDTGIFLANSHAGSSSQNRGTVVRDNEILGYPGSPLAYGILTDGSQEKNNLYDGNRVQNAAVRDCVINYGTGHRVSNNLWLNLGFLTTVAGVAYVNNKGPVGASWPNPIGLFTPTIIGTVSPGVGTYDVQYGTYKVIDNVLYFNLRVTWSAHTGSGFMKVSGLPVACANINNYAPAVTIIADSITYPVGYTTITALVNTGAATVEIRAAADGVGAAPVDVDTAGSLNITGFYDLS